MLAKEVTRLKVFELLHFSWISWRILRICGGMQYLRCTKRIYGYSCKLSEVASYWELPLRIIEESVNRFSFLYSKTEDLVWKWQQSKLCGQSINIILQSTLMPQDHPCNRPDRAREFVRMENDNVIVQLPAYLTRLKPEQYCTSLCK